MEFDFQSSSVMGGTFVSPDFPFADLPKQENQIKETITLKAGGSSQLQIRGTSDNREGIRREN